MTFVQVSPNDSPKNTNAGDVGISFGHNGQLSVARPPQVLQILNDALPRHPIWVSASGRTENCTGNRDRSAGVSFCEGGLEKSGLPTSEGGLPGIWIKGTLFY